MQTISAKDLKTKGIAAIKTALADQPEVVVSVGRKQRFVVMDITHYYYLRECELAAALAETRADLAEGRVAQELPEAHLAKLGKFD